MALAKLAKVQKEISLQPPNLRKANEKALEYIQFMASRTNTDIKSWDVFDTFGGPPEPVEGGTPRRTLLTDKREIGKVFFELIEKAKEKKKEQKKSALDEMPQLLEALQHRVEAQLEGRKATIKRTIRQHIGNAENYHTRMRREHADMLKLTYELTTLEGGDTVDIIRQELDECLKEGYWINPIFENGLLYLNTATNIINTHKNKRANVDISVDLGQFAVKIDLNSFAMWVIPYKNNLRARSYYHPHVSTNGRICWGDGSDQLHNWTSQFKIGSILKLLYSLLHNYSDSAPYCHLYCFKEEAKKYGRIAEALKHPDRRQKKKKATPNLEKLSSGNGTSSEEVVLEATEAPATPTAPVYVANTVIFLRED